MGPRPSQLTRLAGFGQHGRNKSPGGVPKKGGLHGVNRGLSRMSLSRLPLDAMELRWHLRRAPPARLRERAGSISGCAVRSGHGMQVAYVRPNSSSERIDT